MAQSGEFLPLFTQIGKLLLTVMITYVTVETENSKQITVVSFQYTDFAADFELHLALNDKSELS